MKPNKSLIVISAILSSALTSTAADAGNLRVGAAKIDITPKVATGLKNVWGTEFQGIHDHVYVRAIALDNGTTGAALISVDTVALPESLALRRRMEKETGIPAEHILITATHNHNGPIVNDPKNTRSSGAQSEAFTTTVESALLESIREAKAHLQPGKMGLAAGRADININRDEFIGDRWKTGRDPSRPSDKTVWVMRFDNTAGEPIALFVNYGVHPLLQGPDNTLITGDVSGAMSRFIESYYQDKVVALFTPGAAGDQNLIASSWDLDDKLTHKVREPGEQGFQLGDALARILGEEAIRVGDSIRNATSTASIWSMSKDATCPGPGQTAAPGVQPQPIHMDLLMINQIALAGVANELVANIYNHLRRESPLSNTVLVTLTNGHIGYIADDASYGTGIFEAKRMEYRNCGENIIVNFFVDGINRRLSMLDAR